MEVNFFFFNFVCKRYEERYKSFPAITYSILIPEKINDINRRRIQLITIFTLNIGEKLWVLIDMRLAFLKVILVEPVFDYLGHIVALYPVRPTYIFQRRLQLACVFQSVAQVIYRLLIQHKLINYYFNIVLYSKKHYI